MQESAGPLTHGALRVWYPMGWAGGAGGGRQGCASFPSVSTTPHLSLLAPSPHQGWMGSPRFGSNQEIFLESLRFSRGTNLPWKGSQVATRKRSTFKLGLNDGEGLGSP